MTYLHVGLCVTNESPLWYYKMFKASIRLKHMRSSIVHAIIILVTYTPLLVSPLVSTCWILESCKVLKIEYNHVGLYVWYVWVYTWCFFILATTLPRYAVAT